MKKIFTMLLIISMTLFLVACSDSFQQGLSDGIGGTPQTTGESEPESEVTPKAEADTETIAEQEKETDMSGTAEPEQQESADIEYDALQNIFLKLDTNMKPEELEELIEESELYHTKEEYNSSSGKVVKYNIAFTADSALQRYAESGDHLEVEFGGQSKDEFMYAQYVNSKDVSYTALLYDHGTWYSFSDNNAEDYQGYYNVDSFSGNSGITVKYGNGREAKTNYFLCASAEEAIANVMAKIVE